MSPVKLTIHGEYWSSHLYKGLLYLYGLDGSLRILNWIEMIQTLINEKGFDAALEIAFLRGDHLYSKHWRPFLHDSEIKSAIAKKLRELNSASIEISPQHIDRFTKKQIDSPFPFAHNDLLIYKDWAYAASQSGMYAFHTSEFEDKAKTPIKKWDAPISTMDVKLDVLALAAGEHGLFRLPSQTFPQNISGRHEPRITSNKHCQDCNYISSSILISNYETGSSMAEFYSPSVYNREHGNGGGQAFLEDDPLDSNSKVMDTLNFNQGLCWGGNDRMSCFNNGVLATAKYKSTTRHRESEATILDKKSLDDERGFPISAETAVFGDVLEFDDSITVVRSDGVIDNFIGEPTSWSVFPKSHHFTNQLHLIYENRLEVLSFCHDYFVDQKSKVFGTTHPMKNR